MSTAGRGRLAHEQRRAQLVSAAREVFIQGGYHGTTTKDVANAAGVSEALIVKHFGSKEALFRHSMVDPLLDMLRTAAARTPRRAEPDVREERDGLQDFLYGWAKVVREEGPLLWAVLRETRDFPDIAESMAALFRSHVEQVARNIAHGTDRAEYRQFDALAATYTGLAAATMAGLVGDDPESFVSQVVDIIFLGVLAPDGRRSLDPSDHPA